MYLSKNIAVALFVTKFITNIAINIAIQIFYCTVYYITLNSNCEAQRASKNLKKIVVDRVGSQK